MKFTLVLAAALTMSLISNVQSQTIIETQSGERIVIDEPIVSITFGGRSETSEKVKTQLGGVLTYLVQTKAMPWNIMEPTPTTVMDFSPTDLDGLTNSLQVSVELTKDGKKQNYMVNLQAEKTNQSGKTETWIFREMRIPRYAGGWYSPNLNISFSIER